MHPKQLCTVHNKFFRPFVIETNFCENSIKERKFKMIKFIWLRYILPSMVMMVIVVHSPTKTQKFQSDNVVNQHSGRTQVQRSSNQPYQFPSDIHLGLTGTTVNYNQDNRKFTNPFTETNFNYPQQQKVSQATFRQPNDRDGQDWQIFHDVNSHHLREPVNEPKNDQQQKSNPYPSFYSDYAEKFATNNFTRSHRNDSNRLTHTDDRSAAKSGDVSSFREDLTSRDGLIFKQSQSPATGDKQIQLSSNQNQRINTPMLSPTKLSFLKSIDPLSIDKRLWESAVRDSQSCESHLVNRLNQDAPEGRTAIDVGRRICCALFFHKDCISRIVVEHMPKPSYPLLVNYVDLLMGSRKMDISLTCKEFNRDGCNASLSRYQVCYLVFTLTFAISIYMILTSLFFEKKM